MRAAGFWLATTLACTLLGIAGFLVLVCSPFFLKP